MPPKLTMLIESATLILEADKLRKIKKYYTSKALTYKD